MKPAIGLAMFFLMLIEQYSYSVEFYGGYGFSLAYERRWILDWLANIHPMVAAAAVVGWMGTAAILILPDKTWR